MAPSKRPHDNGTRVQALTMLQIGAKIDDIVEKTGYDKRTIYRIQKRAFDRGYDPNVDSRIFIKWVEDAPIPGRPKKVTAEVEDQVIQTISKNSTTRQLSTQAIANMMSPLVKGGISARSVLRALRRRGYK